MEKIVYTVITSKDYKLRDPKDRLNIDWQHICFTNQPRIKSKQWEIIKIKNDHLTNQKLSRKVKILCHKYLPNCDMSLYLDSRFTICCDLNAFVNNYSNKYPLSFMLHNRRNCLYDEAEYLMNMNIGSKYRLLKQIQQYQNEGMPAHFGLYAPGVMIRYHNSAHLIGLMEKWWEEVKKWTYRDIVSLPYALWKTQFTNFNVMPFHHTYELFMDRQNG